MITQTHRFHGHSALAFVYARGRTNRGQLLAVRYVVNRRRSSYRAAVVVSRKVHKSAVVRNRIRRRLYEVIRLRQSAIVEPYDIVVTVYSDRLATLPAAELQTALLDSLAVTMVTADSIRGQSNESMV